MARFWNRVLRNVDKPKQIEKCNKTVHGVTHCTDYLKSSVNTANFNSVNNFLTKAKSTNDSLITVIDSVSEIMENIEKWEGKSKDNFQQVKDENNRMKKLFEGLNVTLEGLKLRNENACREYNKIINTWELHKSVTIEGGKIINHGEDENLRE